MTERNDSLITIIKAKVAAKALSNRVEFNGFRWLAEDEVFEIIRQHTSAPDAMERVTQAIKKVIHNSHGLWEPEDLANAAIAAMNIGDVSARKDETACVGSPTIGGSPSEILAIAEEIWETEHSFARSPEAAKQKIADVLRKYFYTTKPIPIPFPEGSALYDLRSLCVMLKSGMAIGVSLGKGDNFVVKHWKEIHAALEAMKPQDGEEALAAWEKEHNNIFDYIEKQRAKIKTEADTDGDVAYFADDALFTLRVMVFGLQFKDMNRLVSAKANAFTALINSITTTKPVVKEPVAMRYGFDGYGWQYIDNGSGSDWKIRHPNAEALYVD